MGFGRFEADRCATGVARITGMAQAILVICCLIPPAWAEQPKTCRPTLENFRALKAGMSHFQVEKHLGCRGRRGTPVRVGRNTRIDYSWFGHGSFGANIHLTFMNGRLADKSELGLRR